MTTTTQTRCTRTHALPYGQVACSEVAVSLVDGEPCCDEWAFEFGIGGSRVVRLTAATAKAALGALFASTLPVDGDDDDCERGMVRYHVNPDAPEESTDVRPCSECGDRPPVEHGPYPDLCVYCARDAYGGAEADRG